MKKPYTAIELDSHTDRVVDRTILFLQYGNFYMVAEEPIGSPGELVNVVSGPLEQIHTLFRDRVTLAIALSFHLIEWQADHAVLSNAQ